MTIQNYFNRLKQKEVDENISNCLARQKQKEIRKEISELIIDKLK